MFSPGFVEFRDLGRGFYRGYTYQLTKLFDNCDFSAVSEHRHTISFKEASRRLKKSISDAFEYIEIQSGRMITEFQVGKTFVKSLTGISSINPMHHTSWSTIMGIENCWHEHERKGYDGMVVLGCVSEDIIPKTIRETNKAINVTEQTYACGLARSLIQYYLLEEPDERLRNTYIEEKNDSEQLNQDGGIIYVAYKLEPRGDFKTENIKVKEELVSVDINPAAFDILKLKLEEDGLYFRCDIPNDGNSFFRACSDQLDRLDMPAMNPSELRQKVVSEMKLLSEKEAAVANITEGLIAYTAKDGENINDSVVEIMAKFLRRKISIYSRTYSDDISKQSLNDTAEGTPLLLAKEKCYYKSLERGQQIQSVSPEQRNAQKRPGKAVRFDESQPPVKQSKQDSKGHEEGGNVGSKTATVAHVNTKETTGVKEKPTSSLASSSPDKNDTKKEAQEGKKPVIKKMTKDEKLLVLRCYMALSIKTDWDQLTEIVYSKRHEKLSREIVQHYEENLDVSTTLKNRIKSYIQRVLKDKGEKSEKDPEIKSLISLL